MLTLGRTSAVLVLAFLVSCGTAESKKVTLPEKVGGFSRTQNLGLRAVYTGPATVTVTLTEMQSSGNAFEAIQKWKPEPGRVPFQKDKYFGVAESKDLDTKALIAFVADLEKTL
ncbi:MAG: hypothetical protein ABI823_00990 [Bryobacteraceae bacterium]